MKKRSPLQTHLKITWIFTLFLLCLSSKGYAYEGPKYRVLVLHSYNKGLPWTDNISKGIETAFEPIADQIEMKVEYMDSKAVKFDKEFKRKLYDLYKHKYKNSKFNVIISSDDNALTFLRAHHKDLFPSVPVVFSGVNNIQVPELVDRNLFTGILELTAEKETLDLALRLHPETKKVVIICGNTPSGNYRWKQIKPIFRDFPQLKISRLDSSFSMMAIEEKMKNLTSDTIAIFATFYRDKNERFFSLKESVVRISSASKRPIYTYHSQVLNYGTIGGKVLEGLQHGRHAVAMARRMLQGESTVNIPIVKSSLAQYKFDYRELKRFGIDPSELPEKSIIINQPYSFYEDHKELVWATLFSTLCLVLIIVVLLLSIVRRKQAEEELKKARGELEKKVEERTIDFKIAKEEAELANEAKSEFLSNISHELRNPMHQILSYAKYGVEKIDKPKEKLWHYFNQTKKAGERLMVLLNDLLDLSKMESGRMDYKMENSNLFQIVNEAVSELTPAIEEKNLSLKVIDPSVSTKVSCDSYKIGQVVRNLLSNAIKFTPEEKGIEIEFKRNESINEKNTILSLQISVIDQGVGIPVRQKLVQVELA